MGIQKVFDQFVTALETNQMNLLDTVLDKEIVIRSSALGEIKGIEEAKQSLAWKGEKLDFSKIRIFNNVLRKKDDFASQSVFL